MHLHVIGKLVNNYEYTYLTWCSIEQINVYIKICYVPRNITVDRHIHSIVHGTCSVVGDLFVFYFVNLYITLIGKVCLPCTFY